MNMKHSMNKNQKQTPLNESAIAVTTLPFWRQLRWTLVVSLMLFALVPLFIAVIIILNRIDSQTQQQVRQQLESVADLKTDEIELWLDNSQSMLMLILTNQSINDEIFSMLANTNLQFSTEQISKNPVNNLLQQGLMAQTNFEEFFIYTKDGLIIASSNPNQIGKLVVPQPYFANSLTAPIIQSPYYEFGRGELTMLITQPLVDQTTKQSMGILAGRLNLNTLGEIMTERTGLGDSGETYLVSQDYNYLVTPSRFEDEGYTPTFQAYKSIGIDRALNGEDGFGSYSDYRKPAVPIIGVYRWLPQLQVAMLAEVGETEALTLFTQARNFSIVLMGVVALIAISFAIYVANRITKPITGLTQIAMQISQGDLHQQAEISQGNEIGLLATAFNNMTYQLKTLIDSLEERIAARTHGLETITIISKRLNAILSIHELSAAVVNQIQKEFSYYDTHIYLLDHETEHLVVAEGTGLAGAEMKTSGYSIPLNAPISVVAQAARNRQVVRVDNVHEAENWLPNPLLPDTCAEMAIPIILEGQVIGVLDIQEDKPNSLDNGDEELLRSLANQISISMRNARLFEQVETALAEAQALQARYTVQAWKKEKMTSSATQYVYTRSNVAAVDECNQQFMDSVYQQTLHQKKPTMITREEEGVTLLATPIILNNQTIGALQVHPDNTRQTWSNEDADLIQAVVDQFIQTAENLRLFDETRERAGQEQAVREITDKLRAAPDLQHMLNVATQELSQYLSATHAHLKLKIE